MLFPDKDAADLEEWYGKLKPTLPQDAQDVISKTLARKRMQDRCARERETRTRSLSSSSSFRLSRISDLAAPSLSSS